MTPPPKQVPMTNRQFYEAVARFVLRAFTSSMAHNEAVLALAIEEGGIVLGVCGRASAIYDPAALEALFKKGSDQLMKQIGWKTMPSSLSQENSNKLLEICSGMVIEEIWRQWLSLKQCERCGYKKSVVCTRCNSNIRELAESMPFDEDE
jgi:hypothetical protein